MKPEFFVTHVLDPGLRFLNSIDGKFDPEDPRARQLLMAIAGQESDYWKFRLQKGGPARSYWQFEQGGGVNGVLTHAATAKTIREVCAALDIACDTRTVYDAMAWNDTLACCMARLNLWWAPAPLPAIGDLKGSWDYYIDCWRPGLPHPEKWQDVYETSQNALEEVDEGRMALEIEEEDRVKKLVEEAEARGRAAVPETTPPPPPPPAQENGGQSS